MPSKKWCWLSLLLVGVLPGDSLPPALQPSGRISGLPADFDAKAATQPYRGPHPSLLQRPAETYAFPIRLGDVGPATPLFAGARQYPLVCDTEASGLGQPLVDNQAGIGTPVIQNTEDGNATPRPSGYSQDCLARSQAWYYYKPRDSTKFARWSDSAQDVDDITVAGVRMPFVVRVEMGTINRFIYLLAALKGADETLETPGADRWNKRLIYQFHGGVGIGHRQGKIDPQKLLTERREQLARGYAVVASTGTISANHYNIWLAEDTALRVKRQFVALYGEPEYTVGVGGSGGAIQQYLLAQNRPGLIDAGIAQYSYPDMITQTIPIFDCELLEYYFDVTDRGNPLWRKAKQRQWVEGLNADNAFTSKGRVRKIEWATRLARLTNGEWPQEVEGQTECVVGWRGLTPLVLNPRFAHFEDRLSEAVFRRVQWSYFEDLKDYFGTDPRGYARIPWDNVGVQYGLQALRRGQLSAHQFLQLNARIGSWKAPADMAQERYWILNGARSGLHEFSPWSEQNINLGNGNQPAPRFAGDRAAMAAAYRSGQVFLGRLDIPVIDERHYLDPELNMHHAAGSFSVRARLLAAQGHAGSHAIWVSDKNFDPTPQAFAAIDQWLQAKRTHPERSWAELRPPTANDRCFDARGRVLASGDRVWDGAWNQQPPGACLRTYPIHSNSRMEAGDDIRGDVFKCTLQPVADALAAGVYAPVDMRPYRGQLEQIFPQGVCDYRLGDQGRPSGGDWESGRGGHAAD